MLINKWCKVLHYQINNYFYTVIKKDNNKMKNKITPPPVPPKDINEWFEYISAMATKVIIAGFLIEIVYHTTK